MKLQLETVRLGYSVKSYIPTNHSSKYNINPPTSNNSPKFSELFVLSLFNIISFYEHQTPIYQLHLPRKKERKKFKYAYRQQKVKQMACAARNCDEYKHHEWNSG
jgi:hypothetical protein